MMIKRLFAVTVLLLPALEYIVQAVSGPSLSDHDLYKVMAAGTNQCDNENKYERMTSPTQCQAYADHESIPYDGVGVWVREPVGCNIHRCTAHFNTHPTGRGNKDNAHVCINKEPLSVTQTSKSKSKEYKVMNSRSNQCDDGYDPLTPAECFMYACSVNRTKDYDWQDSWPGDPKGCIISNEDELAWFNEHPTGVSNDDYHPVCKQVTPDGVVLSPPTDYRLSFKIKPLGTMSGFVNIIQFTAGEHGSKAPAIFFNIDSTKLYVQISTDSFPNHPYPTHISYNLELNKSHNIVLEVAGLTSTLTINNGTPDVRSITSRSQLPNLNVYIGSPWYEPANAVISEIKFGPASFETESEADLFGTASFETENEADSFGTSSFETENEVDFSISSQYSPPENNVADYDTSAEANNDKKSQKDYKVKKAGKVAKKSGKDIKTAKDKKSV